MLIPQKISMSPVEAAHTATRQYCREQAEFLYRRETDSRVHENQQEAQAIYPRYYVLEAILCDVERTTPDDFSTLDDAVDWLMLAGEAAQSGFTLNLNRQNGAAQAAMQEERIRFGAFVRGFVSAGQWEAEPLPYRRTLSASESGALWSGIKERWGVAGGWYPLTGDAPPHTLVFDPCAFEERFGPERFGHVLSGAGVERVFELSEFLEEPEYEIDTVLVDGIYRGSEKYWTPPTMDWLIYASHHGTVTVTGKAVVDAVAAFWPEYQNALSQLFTSNHP